MTLTGGVLQCESHLRYRGRYTKENNREREREREMNRRLESGLSDKVHKLLTRNRGMETDDYAIVSNPDNHFVVAATVAVFFTAAVVNFTAVVPFVAAVTVHDTISAQLVMP